MSDYFTQLAAVLSSQAIPEFGTAAVQSGEGWVVVDYNVDGRISWHRPCSQEGRYLARAPLVSHELGGPEPTPLVASELAEFLTAKWVALPLPD